MELQVGECALCVYYIRVQILKTVYICFCFQTPLLGTVLNPTTYCYCKGSWKTEGFPKERRGAAERSEA